MKNSYIAGLQRYRFQTVISAWIIQSTELNAEKNGHVPKTMDTPGFFTCHDIVP